jgi:SAM-dependent methyltransferase
MKWILDIGSGHHPNPVANLFLDRNLTGCADREGLPAVIKENMVIGDALYLPFKDKSIHYLLSNHVIEHTDSPEQFLKECNRVSDIIHITAPGLLHEIWRELAFESSSYTHKWVHHPVKKWIPMNELISKRPHYTKKQEIYIKIIRILPRRIKHLIWSNLIYILDDYMKNVDVNIVEFEYIKNDTIDSV